MLKKGVIRFVTSEGKNNQREMVKVPDYQLRDVLSKGMNAQKTEDFIIKVACEHYRKYLIRQRNRDER